MNEKQFNALVAWVESLIEAKTDDGNSSDCGSVTAFREFELRRELRKQLVTHKE